MGGAFSSGATYFSYGKAGALVADVAVPLHEDDVLIDEKTLLNRLQKLQDLCTKEPNEYQNLQKLLWSPGHDRATAFFRRLFQSCMSSLSLETKRKIIAFVLWMGEFQGSGESDHKVIMETGLIPALVDILRYDATYYLEEVLSTVTRTCIVFSQYGRFAEEFLESHGDTLICDILSVETTEAVLHNVVVSLYLLSEWKKLDLVAHQSQVPALAKALLHPSDFYTTAAAYVVLAMAEHADPTEAETNRKELTQGGIFPILLEAVGKYTDDDAARDGAIRRRKKAAQVDIGQDPFAEVMLATRALLRGIDENSPTIDVSRGSEFISTGGLEKLVSHNLNAIKVLQDVEDVDESVTKQIARYKATTELLADISEVEVFEAEVLASECIETCILLFCITRYTERISIEASAAALRLLWATTRSTPDIRNRVVLHESSVSLLGRLNDAPRRTFTKYHVRLFTNLIPDEYLDAPVPFGPEAELHLVRSLSSLIAHTMAIHHWFEDAEYSEVFKNCLKLLMRLSRKADNAAVVLQSVNFKTFNNNILLIEDSGIKFYAAHFILQLQYFANDTEFKAFRRRALPAIALKFNSEVVQEEKERMTEPPPTYREYLVLYECTVAIQKVVRAWCVRRGFLEWKRQKRTNFLIGYFATWTHMIKKSYPAVRRRRARLLMQVEESNVRSEIEQEFLAGFVTHLREFDASMLYHLSALNIQKVFRGHQARKELPLRKLEYARRLDQGRTISQWWKMQRAKKAVEERKKQFHIRETAVAELQRIGRGYIARRWVGFHYVQMVSVQAAITIQRLWRGHKGRVLFRKKLFRVSERTAEENKCAETIQRVFRGWMVRQDLRSLYGREQDAVAYNYQADQHRVAAVHARQEAEKLEKLALEAEQKAREQRIMRRIEEEERQAQELRTNVLAKQAQLKALKEETEKEAKRNQDIQDEILREKRELEANKEAAEKEYEEWYWYRRRHERRAAEKAAQSLLKEKQEVKRLMELARKKREEEMQWERDMLLKQGELLQSSQAELDKDLELQAERRRLQMVEEGLDEKRRELKKNELADQQRQRELAALEIQRCWRGHLARMEAWVRFCRRQYILVTACCRVQAFARGLCTRRMLLRQHYACISIQRTYRGHLGRKATLARREELAKEHMASYKLQRIWNRDRSPKPSPKAVPEVKTPLSAPEVPAFEPEPDKSLSQKEIYRPSSKELLSSSSSRDLSRTPPKRPLTPLSGTSPPPEVVFPASYGNTGLALLAKAAQYLPPPVDRSSTPLALNAIELELESPQAQAGSLNSSFRVPSALEGASLNNTLDTSQLQLGSAISILDGTRHRPETDAPVKLPPLFGETIAAIPGMAPARVCNDRKRLEMESILKRDDEVEMLKKLRAALPVPAASTTKAGPSTVKSKPVKTLSSDFAALAPGSLAGSETKLPGLHPAGGVMKSSMGSMGSSMHDPSPGQLIMMDSMMDDMASFQAQQQASEVYRQQVGEILEKHQHLNKLQDTLQETERALEALKAAKAKKKEAKRAKRRPPSATRIGSAGTRPGSGLKSRKAQVAAPRPTSADRIVDKGAKDLHALGGGEGEVARALLIEQFQRQELQWEEERMRGMFAQDGAVHGSIQQVYAAEPDPMDNSLAAIVHRLFKDDPAFRSVNLNYQNLTDVSVSPILHALKDNTNLRSINLNSNHLTDVSAEGVCQAIRGNSTLTSMSIAGNFFAEEGSRAILQAMQFNNSIVYFEIGAQNSEDSGRWMPQIKAAMTVVLSRNKINALKKGPTALAAAPLEAAVAH